MATPWIKNFFYTGKRRAYEGVSKLICPLFVFKEAEKNKKALTFTSWGFVISEKICIFLKIKQINVNKDTLSRLQSQTIIAFS